MPFAAETRSSATTARVLVAFFFIIIININILSDSHRASRTMKVIIPEEDRSTVVWQWVAVFNIATHTCTRTHAHMHTHTMEIVLCCLILDDLTSPPALGVVVMSLHSHRVGQLPQQPGNRI